MGVHYGRLATVTYGGPSVKTFKDSRPFLGQDPHIVQWNDTFLLIQSAYNNTRIVIKQFEHLHEMNRNQSHTVWLDPKHKEIWAPELHEIDSKWYIYFAASHDGQNENHRMYVLEADHPLGPYHSLGRLIVPEDEDVWAIDQTILIQNDALYAIWSGWDKKDDGMPQRLYIAAMESPTTLSGNRVLLSSPTLPWEQVIAPLLEGPQVLQTKEKLFISYSADASWSQQEYSVGLLEYTGANILDPLSWTKLPVPFLTGGGHGAFFIYNNETYYCYHRKLSHESGWQDREIRYTTVEWDPNGYPHLSDS